MRLSVGGPCEQFWHTIVRDIQLLVLYIVPSVGHK